MPIFSDDIVQAVLNHMNGDHTDDNLLIVRAFGEPDAESATMIDLDENGGSWSVTIGGTAKRLDVPWPAGRITERGEVRREVVALYDQACERLGITPREH